MTGVTSIPDRYAECSASDRLVRAMTTLRFTGTRTTCRWLALLCEAKYTEAAAVEKLDASGYHVRFNRTDARRVY